MPKKKNNTNLFLLIGLIVIAGIYFFISQSDKKKGESTFRSELVNINKDDITRIKIKPSRTPEDIVDLYKDGDDWKTKLKDGREIIAQADAVEGIFRQMETIKPKRVAANNQSKWADYQVDDKGTRIEFFEGNKKAADLTIGKFDVDQNSLQGQQQFGGASQPKFTSYMRLTDEDKVYAVSGFYEELNSQKVDNFRDKDLFKSGTDKITQIRFNYPDSSYQLTYKDSWKINGVPVDSNKVVSYLRTLENMSISEFDEKPTASKATMDIQIQSGKDIIKLNAFKTDKDNYTLHSSDLPLDYFSGKNVFNRLFVGKDNFPKKKKIPANPKRDKLKKR